MMNTFEITYTKVQNLHKSYLIADEAGKVAIRASYNALMEEIDALGEAARRIWREYESSRDCGNEYLNINDVVLDKDAESLISCMREHGIEKFTFSSSWSNAMETAWLFKKAGCKVEDLVEVKMQYHVKKEPAYLFSL